jgi:hypothetical protein
LLLGLVDTGRRVNVERSNSFLYVGSNGSRRVKFCNVNRSCFRKSSSSVELPLLPLLVLLFPVPALPDGVAVVPTVAGVEVATAAAAAAAAAAVGAAVEAAEIGVDEDMV